jgi:hypothetical protein
MEPVFMILGQSSATAASLAIDGRRSVQKVDYTKLRAQLLEDGQALEWTGAARAEAAPASKLEGVVLDDSDAQKVGDWSNGSLTESRRVGTGYIHDGNSNKGAASVTWTPVIKEAGSYDVIMHFPPNPNRATNVPVTISRRGGEPRIVIVNEKKGAGSQSLGVFDFGKGETVTISVSNKETDGYVVVDGVQLLRTRD